MSGNLSYQVEHHLFPDMPSSRYKEIAPKVKAICEQYELPYNTGPFLQQWLMVQRTILRLAFPGGCAAAEGAAVRRAARGLRPRAGRAQRRRADSRVPVAGRDAAAGHVPALYTGVLS